MTYDTSRIRRMRQRMLARPAVCVERCAILTRSFQATEGESAPIRRARAFADLLDQMTIRIEPDELVVGRPTSKVRGGSISPELQCGWILDELDLLSTRDTDPVLQLLLDVRRQGHFPKALQRFQKNTLVVEPDQAVAAFHFAHHLCGERAVAKAYLRTGVQLLARTNQALPHFLAPVDQQQHLAGPPCLPASQQTGGKHPAVVEH